MSDLPPSQISLCPWCRPKDGYFCRKHGPYPPKPKGETVRSLRERIEELELEREEWRIKAEVRQETIEILKSEIALLRKALKKHEIEHELGWDYKTLVEAYSELEEKNEGLREERARLMVFVGKAMFWWPDGRMPDMGDFQEMAEKCGLLELQRRTEFCQENCRCAEYFGDDEEEFLCYRVSPLLRDAVIKAREAE